MSIPKDHWNTIRRGLLCLYFLSYILHSCAQSYTALDEKTLYLIPILQRPQLFSLDLTRSWDAAKAPLELLPDPPLDLPFLYLSALAVNYDKKSLLYFNSHRAPSVYNITTRTWQLGTRLTDPTATLPPRSIYGNQVATDPSTGIAYIPSVEYLDNFPIYTYNTSQGYAVNVTKTIVPGVSTSYEYYGAVWSTVRKSVLFYGGRANRTIPVGLMEYQPSNNQWTNVKTQGATTPGEISSPCIASAYSGMKIVMFGNGLPPYSVFILDVNTLVWTKGAEPRIGEERTTPTCAVVGDYFIVAGGSPGSGGGILQPVIVYNIKLNQWTDSYEAPYTPSVSSGVGNPSTTETGSPVADQGQSSGEGMTLGTKIGIIAGGSSILLILLTCGAFIIHRQRKRKSHQAPQQLENISSPYFDKSTLQSSKNRQLPAVQSRALREAPSLTHDGHLKSQAARNPQLHSSSIPTVTIQQWQCTQQGQDPQYISPPSSAPTTPAHVQYPQHDPQDDHGSYHNRLDYGAFYHDQRRRDPEEDPDHNNMTVDYSVMCRNRHTNDPQASYGDPNDDDDYLLMYQDRRMNAPQEYSHSSAEKDFILRRLNPQDHTRRSTASQLEYYQVQPSNNPQDYGHQVDQDDDTLYQEIHPSQYSKSTCFNDRT